MVEAHGYKTYGLDGARDSFCDKRGDRMWECGTANQGDNELKIHSACLSVEHCIIWSPLDEDIQQSRNKHQYAHNQSDNDT
jgi:hypothetical protein